MKKFLRIPEKHAQIVIQSTPWSTKKRQLLANNKTDSKKASFIQLLKKELTLRSFESSIDVIILLTEN